MCFQGLFRGGAAYTSTVPALSVMCCIRSSAVLCCSLPFGTIRDNVKSNKKMRCKVNSLPSQRCRACSCRTTGEDSDEA